MPNKAPTTNHGVKCANCAKNQNIRVTNISGDKRFSPKHEFYCAKLECRRALLRKNRTAK